MSSCFSLRFNDQEGEGFTFYTIVTEYSQSLSKVGQVETDGGNKLKANGTLESRKIQNVELRLTGFKKILPLEVKSDFEFIHKHQYELRQYEDFLDKHGGLLYHTDGGVGSVVNSIQENSLSGPEQDSCQQFQGAYCEKKGDSSK